MFPVLDYSNLEFSSCQKIESLSKGVLKGFPYVQLGDRQVNLNHMVYTVQM